MSATTDVPASITTSDAVLRSLATFEPDDGAPMPDPAERLGSGVTMDGRARARGGRR
jgi:hypothetical protein